MALIPSRTFDPYPEYTSSTTDSNPLGDIVTKVIEILSTVARVGRILAVTPGPSEVATVALRYTAAFTSILESLRKEIPKMEAKLRQYIDDKISQNVVNSISAKISAITPTFGYLVNREQLNDEFLKREVAASNTHCREILTLFENMSRTLQGNIIYASALLLTFAPSFTAIQIFLAETEVGYREEMESNRDRLIKVLSWYKDKCLEERMTYIDERSYHYQCIDDRSSCMGRWAEYDADTDMEYRNLSNYNESLRVYIDKYRWKDRWEYGLTGREFDTFEEDLKRYKKMVKNLYAQKFDEVIGHVETTLQSWTSR